MDTDTRRQSKVREDGRQQMKGTPDAEIDAHQGFFLRDFLHPLSTTEFGAKLQ